MPRHVMIASTPVGPLGSGAGGGVELTLHGIATGLLRRGHRVTVLAPEGSLLVAGAEVVQVPGAPQVPSQNETRDTPVSMPPSSVLGNIWDEVRRRQHDVDIVLNLAYDWLPLYLTPFLSTSVAHLISMGSLNDAMDDAVARLAESRPGALGAHTHAQAATFPVPAGAFRIVGSGVDVARYDFNPTPDDHLGWVGRIAPEKGIDDVFALSERTGIEVRVCGLMEHEHVWEDAVAAHPDALVTYAGFLPTDQLQAALRRCRALVMTPRWVEAFGNVAIEAMACGVPVIAYRRGGPAEIVRDGLEGFVVPADDIDALAAAVERIGEIDRAACRARVEAEYSVDALACRIDAWFDDLLAP